MPLQLGTDPHVVSANVEELVGAGHPVRQAVAIAHSFSRRPSAPLQIAREFADRAARWHETSRRRADDAYAGIPVVIENPAGSVRRWTQQSGESGETFMHHDYGYFRDSTGADGEGVDVYRGPDASAQTAYVVHQMAPPEFSEHDEDKVMVGFSSPETAKVAYMNQYDDPRFFGSMTAMPIAELKRRLGHDVADLRDDPESLASLFTRQVCDYHTQDTASRTGTAHIFSPRVASSAALQAEAMLRSCHTAEEARAVAHGHVDELWTQLGALWGQQLTGAANRVDEWDESQHPRGGDGRFGEGGEHAAIAERHAAVAKAAASGTTPAARASARKAAEHAALSRVAAQHFDAVGAEHHTKEAERHSLAAQMKATAHVQPSIVERTSAPTQVKAILTPKVTAHEISLKELRLVKSSTNLAGVEFTSKAQRDLRIGMNQEMAKLGLTDRDGFLAHRSSLGEHHIADGRHAHRVDVVTPREVGGALGTHDRNSGRIKLSVDEAKSFTKVIERGLAAVANEWRQERAGSVKEEEAAKLLKAYQVVSHEVAHGHGPSVEYKGIGAAVEELTTELSARQVTRSQMGLSAVESAPLFRQYAALVLDARNRVAAVTGSTSVAVAEHLERASVRFKSMPASTSILAHEAVHHFVSHIDLDAVTGRVLNKTDRDSMTQQLTNSLGELSVARDQSTIQRKSRP